MSTNSDLKFKIRKWTDIGKLSIKPQTVRPRTADRPPMDRGPSAASGTGQSDQQCRPSELIRPRTVRRPCADRPRQAVKSGRGRRLVICVLCPFSLTLHSPNSLLCRLCADGEVTLRTDSPTACGNVQSTCLPHGIS
jgi:hypothetical protein